MRSALTLVLLFIPAAAISEGARMELNCTVPDGTARSFVFAPVERDASGAGSVAVGEDMIPGTAGGTFGPWSWSKDAVRYTLLVNGSATPEGVPFLLHALDTNTDPYGVTQTELTCEAPL